MSFSRHWLLLCVALAVAGCTSTAPKTATTEPTQPVSHTDAIARAGKYLVNSPQPDGSWGTGTETRGYEIYAMVPGSLDSFRVATTALCVMALREAGETTAHDKGVQYLVTQGEARRDSGDLLYNVWTHTY